MDECYQLIEYRSSNLGGHPTEAAAASPSADNAEGVRRRRRRGRLPLPGPAAAARRGAAARAPADHLRGRWIEVMKRSRLKFFDILVCDIP